MRGSHLSLFTLTLSATKMGKSGKAVLNYARDNRARATEILDIDVERQLLETCLYWAVDNVTKQATPREQVFTLV